MKLRTVTFDRTPRIPGLRTGDLTTLNLENPPEALKEWRLTLRGQMAFLISPPGWVSGKPRREWDPKGPRIVFEIPRVDMFFEWVSDDADLDAVCKGGRYDSEPFGPPPQPILEDKPLLSQIPANEIGDA